MTQSEKENLTLVSIGSINADFQVSTERAIGTAETMRAKKFCRLPGGKASNRAYLGTKFGITSILLGCVGSDELGDQTLDQLKTVGIDTSKVHRAKESPTGVSMIIVPPEGKKNIILATNANDEWSELSINNALTVLGSLTNRALLCIDCEIPAFVVEILLERAKNLRIPVVLDPSFPEQVPVHLLSSLLAIAPNTEEAYGLSGIKQGSFGSAVDAAKYLHNVGVSLACIKLSDGGCVACCDELCFHVPAGHVKVVDSTGAGDAFTGVLAIALLEGKASVEAVSLAVAAANLSVTGYGSQSSYPNRIQVETYARQIMTHARILSGRTV